MIPCRVRLQGLGICFAMGNASSIGDRTCRNTPARDVAPHESSTSAVMPFALFSRRWRM